MRQIKTTFLQKIGLVAVGFLLTFLLLEGAIRLGGWIVISLQEHRNARSLRKDGTYRIMCIGESTTQNQYPPLLERILNRRNIGVKFSVIDKGRIGKNTSIILSQLESDLDVYHPDMVIAMMGINDRGPHMPHEPMTSSKPVLYMRSLKTYELTRLLWLHIVTKSREIGLYRPQNENELTQRRDSDIGEDPQEGAFKKAISINPRDEQAYHELGRLYERSGEFAKAEYIFKKSLAMNPRHGNVYLELGRLYMKWGKSSAAEDTYKQVIAINPRDFTAYVELAKFYKNSGKSAESDGALKKALATNPGDGQAYRVLGFMYTNFGEFPKAEDAFKKAIAINRMDDRACVGLGELYRRTGQFAASEDILKKAIAIAPGDLTAHIELAWLYSDLGKSTKAEIALKKAFVTIPKSDHLYFSLGRVYKNLGEFQKAEGALRNAPAINPSNDNAYYALGGLYRKLGRLQEAAEILKKTKDVYLIDLRDRSLASVYGEMGNSGLANYYYDKATEWGSNVYDPVLMANYHRLQDILNRRRIKLICVQYPMRSVEPLKEIFQGRDEDIVFVDNEKIFRDAVKKSSYGEYFRDMFGGDFGHCTDKGNQLLAQNIADDILRFYFHR